MALIKNVLNGVDDGLRPMKISLDIGLSIKSVTQEITKAVRDGRVPRSRVLGTLEVEWRDQLAVWVPAWNKSPHAASPEFIHEQLRDSNQDYDLDVEEVRLYLICFERGFTDGAMYELLCEIERTLHAKIKQVLIKEHGAEEAGWWRVGVPLDVRNYCVKHREEDTNFCGNQPYNYTTLGHLGQILKYGGNPAVFKNRLPLAEDGKAPSLQEICSDLEKLGKVRNRVMHPIGTVPPTDEDFLLAKELHDKFAITKWR